MKEDLKLPEDEPELCEKIREDFGAEKEILITVISAMEKEKIVSHREGAKNKWIILYLFKYLYYYD